MSGTVAIVRESAMRWDVQQDCVDCATHALLTLQLETQSAVAQFIKKELDSKYGHRWHVIVGHSFGGFAGHDTGSFVFFSIEDVYFMIWQIDKCYEEKEVRVDALVGEQKRKRDALPNY